MVFHPGNQMLQPFRIPDQFPIWGPGMNIECLKKQNDGDQEQRRFLFAAGRQATIEPRFQY